MRLLPRFASLTDFAWLLLFSYLRAHRNLTDPGSHAEFFRLSEPVVTLIGYGFAAVVGWLLNPAAALVVFLVFPAIYVIRVRSAEQ